MGLTLSSAAFDARSTIPCRSLRTGGGPCLTGTPHALRRHE